MSRSWERQVRRNSAQLNKQRKKQGKPGISSHTVEFDEFKGRNFILPLILTGFTIIYALLGSVGTNLPSPMLYWVTVICYLGLALMLFLRRPFLRVTKDELSTTKWNRLRTLKVEDIKKITYQPGFIVIEKNGKGSNWVFSRMMNRYDIEAMHARLQQFAAQNRITYEENSKSDKTDKSKETEQSDKVVFVKPKK
ncbi:methyltransferase [Paenibacillus dendritiformis]|uniref:methyltransferase n=1 Tax=Paenibacillus dendritiformis TaxID=130049 RepID=UPI00105A1CA7|nr:methyltransferase [Paenibacillus dendritiformis]TDL53964.1 methyltransferase [Paenibacillus dendritiformis]